MLEGDTVCPVDNTPNDERVHPPQRFMHLDMRPMVRDMNALLRELLLAMPQMGTLHFLDAEGDRSVSAIAGHLNVSLAATSHLVERLVQPELLPRAEDPFDRRHERGALAPEGAQLVARIQRQAAAFDEVLEPLPSELRRRFEAIVLEVLWVLVAAETPAH